MSDTDIDALENLKELFLETGHLQKWARDPRVREALRGKGRDEGEAVVRHMTLSSLTWLFGELLKARIATENAAWCENLFYRAITATSLSELIETLK